MKRVLVLLAILTLGGCARLQSLATVASATVTPTEALVAANAFDAAESGATGFLTFCKASPASASCVADNRRLVLRYVRAGRAARNQMETYIQTSTSVPSAIYNAVVTAMDNLKTTPAANYVGER